MGRTGFRTGVWTVGAVPDGDVAALPLRFSDTEGAWSVPDGYADDLRWWLEGGDRAPYFTPGPTAAARRFDAFARSGGPTAPAVAAMKEASLDLLRDAGDGTAAPDARFVVSVPGGDPAIALYHGLGAEAAAQLPGSFGDFLLRADEVRGVLPHAEAVLAVTGPRRTEVLARIDAWLSAMSAAPADFDSAELLAGPLRVLRHAAATGAGALGVTSHGTSDDTSGGTSDDTSDDTSGGTSGQRA